MENKPEFPDLVNVYWHAGLNSRRDESQVIPEMDRLNALFYAGREQVRFGDINYVKVQDEVFFDHNQPTVHLQYAKLRK